MNDSEAIDILEKYRELVAGYNRHTDDKIRRLIVKGRNEIEHIIKMAGCWKTVTVGPPPAIGGFIQRNVNPFELLFDNMHGQNTRRLICDIIDESIGAIGRGNMRQQPRNEPSLESAHEKNYAFLAMPIDNNDKVLQDVHDTVKLAAQTLGITAERVDEQQKNERITDRILESIRRAEYVICDLSHTKPNVYYEAGYAQGLGKVPIYLAKTGTMVQFDIKDYPIIFYDNMRELRDGLTSRLKGLISKNMKPE